MIDTGKIYCSVTGKAIATIDDDELGLIIESSLLHPLAIQGELERRVLLAMRPSSLWLSITPESLETIRLAAPRQLLAYLMNRLYAPVVLKADTPELMTSRMNNLRARIALWEHIESAVFAPDQLDQLLLLLLELDSRFNLSKLSKPAYLVSPFADWSASHLKDFMDALIDWRDKLVAKQVKDQLAAKASAEWWSGGNRLTRKAFAQQFMGTKPPSKAAEKREAKAKEANLLDSLLDAVMSGDFGDKAETPAPAKKPTTNLLFLGVKQS